MSSLKRQNAFSSNQAPKKYKPGNRTSITNAISRLRSQIDREHERKETWNSTVGTTILSVGNVQSLCSIAVGTDSLNQRIGRKVRYDKLYLSYLVNMGAGVTQATTADAVTVCVWLDREAQAATPAYATMMDISNGIGLAGLAHKNTYQSDGRFKCLYMKTFSLAYGDTCNVADRVVLDLKKMLKGRDQQADWGQSTIGPPNINGLFITYGNTASGLANPPTMNFNAKLLYTDA